MAAAVTSSTNPRRRLDWALLRTAQRHRARQDITSTGSTPTNVYTAPSSVSVGTLPAKKFLLHDSARVAIETGSRQRHSGVTG